MNLFLFIATLIAGGAFANEGGHKCIEQDGIKTCVERMVDQGQPVDYSKLNQ